VDCVVGRASDETVPLVTKPFFVSGAELRKQRLVIKRTTRTAAQRRQDNGDRQMRTFSFILAFAFVLAAPSLAGSYDSGLPGIGAFAYNGSPVASSVPRTVLVALR
jgi:hypothetical protein